jgi:hypothetical protein
MVVGVDDVAIATSPWWGPTVIAAGAGVLGAIGGVLAGGLGKKDMITYNTTRTSQDVYHAPYETYAPSIQYAPVSSYAYQGATNIINSPYATANPKLAQAVTSQPNQTPTYNLPQTYSPAATVSNPTGSGLLADVNWTWIAIIAGVAIVGYAYFKKD